MLGAKRIDRYFARLVLAQLDAIDLGLSSLAGGEDRTKRVDELQRLGYGAIVGGGPSGFGPVNTMWEEA